MRCLKTGRLFSRQDRKDQGSGHCLAPGGWEDLGCVMIYLPGCPSDCVIFLCFLFPTPFPHRQLVGSQFSLAQLLYSDGGN